MTRNTFLASAAAAAVVAGLAAAPAPAAADDLSSFVAGVATGALLGGAVNPYQPNPYPVRPPAPTYYYPAPSTRYVYVAPPQPRYVYVTPAPSYVFVDPGRGHYDHGRWHRWHPEGDD